MCVHKGEHLGFLNWNYTKILLNLKYQLCALECIPKLQVLNQDFVFLCEYLSTRVTDKQYSGTSTYKYNLFLRGVQEFVLWKAFSYSK